jgi:hypothetical protein
LAWNSKIIYYSRTWFMTIYVCYVTVHMTSFSHRSSFHVLTEVATVFSKLGRPKKHGCNFIILNWKRGIEIKIWKAQRKEERVQRMNVRKKNSPLNMNGIFYELFIIQHPETLVAYT